MDPTRTFCRIDFDLSPENCKGIIDSNKISLTVVSGNVPLNKSRNLRFYNHAGGSTDYPEDPFTLMDPTPFKNLAAYDLASIDAYFNITGFGSGLTAPQLMRFQNYAISGSSDLGMAEYIQYRNIITFIYFLEEIHRDISETNINLDRIMESDFLIRKKERYRNIEYYSSLILGIDQFGVDVYIIQGYTSDVDLICQVIILLEVLKIGGDGIVRLHGLNKLSIDLIIVLANVFDSVSLFKTCTLGLYSNDIYLVCKHFNQTSNKGKKKDLKSETIMILKEIVKRGEYHQDFNGLLENENRQVSDYASRVTSLIEQERVTDEMIDYVPDKIRAFLSIS